MYSASIQRHFYRNLHSRKASVIFGSDTARQLLQDPSVLHYLSDFRDVILSFA